jgi:hypothetical protein
MFPPGVPPSLHIRTDARSLAGRQTSGTPSQAAAASASSYRSGSPPAHVKDAHATLMARVVSNLDVASKRSHLPVDWLVGLSGFVLEETRCIAIRLPNEHSVKHMLAGNPTKGLNIKGKTSEFALLAGFIPLNQELSKLRGETPERIAKANASVQQCIEDGHARPIPLVVSNEEITRLSVAGTIMVRGAEAELLVPGALRIDVPLQGAAPRRQRSLDPSMASARRIAQSKGRGEAGNAGRDEPLRFVAVPTGSGDDYEIREIGTTEEGAIELVPVRLLANEVDGEWRPTVADLDLLESALHAKYHGPEDAARKPEFLDTYTPSPTPANETDSPSLQRHADEPGLYEQLSEYAFPPRRTGSSPADATQVEPAIHGIAPSRFTASPMSISPLSMRASPRPSLAFTPSAGRSRSNSSLLGPSLSRLPGGLAVASAERGLLGVPSAARPRRSSTQDDAGSRNTPPLPPVSSRSSIDGLIQHRRLSAISLYSIESRGSITFRQTEDLPILNKCVGRTMDNPVFHHGPETRNDAPVSSDKVPAAFIFAMNKTPGCEPGSVEDNEAVIVIAHDATELYSIWRDLRAMGYMLSVNDKWSPTSKQAMASPQFTGARKALQERHPGLPADDHPVRRHSTPNLLLAPGLPDLRLSPLQRSISGGPDVDPTKQLTTIPEAPATARLA